MTRRNVPFPRSVAGSARRVRDSVGPVTLDEWGEPVHLPFVLGIPARKRLEMERDQLASIIAKQRDHVEAGTRSPDPDPPEDILRWAQERLAIIEGRLATLDDDE
jgi:hypothetical protein